MHKLVRTSLIIGALYCVGSYYVDRPEEVGRDVAALQDMAARLPEPEAVVEHARETGEAAGQQVDRARNRLDDVRETVSAHIATGADRFAGND